MLKAGSNLLGRLAVNDLKCGNTPFSLEFVRWKRKPRWLPVAKTKMFRVPERKPQKQEERLALMKLHNNYRTELRHVLKYLREHTKRVEETSTADHFVLTPEQEEAEFQRCMQINAEWNATIAAERDQRLAKEREDRATRIAERLEAARIRQEEQTEAIEAIVKREQELSKTFITKDNLDAAIEFALANPVDYNFSIDLKGNIYRGRTTEPSSSGSPATTNTTQNPDVTSEVESKKLEAIN